MGKRTKPPRMQSFRAICLQCDQPIATMEANHQDLTPQFLPIGMTVPVHGDATGIITVICQPCGHTLGARLWTKDGRARDIRSDPAPPVEVEGARDGLCQRCGRHSIASGAGVDPASLVSWCCEAHHWSICLRCARQIMDRPFPVLRARLNPAWFSLTPMSDAQSAAADYVTEHVFCPLPSNRLLQSDQRVPVLDGLT